jgi:hypothetical protein
MVCPAHVIVFLQLVDAQQFVHKHTNRFDGFCRFGVRVLVGPPRVRAVRKANTT